MEQTCHSLEFIIFLVPLAIQIKTNQQKGQKKNHININLNHNLQQLSEFKS